MLATTTHVFSEMFVHLNWHCKDDLPMITAEIEPKLYRLIESYCARCKGIKILAQGGTADHVHLLLQFEPMVELADWIGKVKGSTAHDINQAMGRVLLKWQRGYGAVSCAKHDLEKLKRYVENQKRHHEEGSVNKTLESHGDYAEQEQS